MCGQCTPSMLQEIKGKHEYEKKHKNSDALWLMQTIRGICAGIDDKNNKMFTYATKMTDLFTMRQYSTETLDDWLKRV